MTPLTGSFRQSRLTRLSFEVFVMRTKLVFCFVAVVGLAAGLSALAQTQTTQVTVPEIPASASSIDNQGIRRYLLGPGDILDVRVFGQADLNSTVEIDEDGNISSLPFVEEPIPARCRNEKEVQKSITEAYSKYIIKPRVSVRIMERRSRPPAAVFGAVRTPARVPMNRRLRLHELLVTAGGITQGASGTIQVVHTEPEMCPSTEELALKAVTGDTPPVAASATSDLGMLETFLISGVKSGEGKGDPFIRPGDIVIVTEGEPIFITGAVFSPREIVMKDQMTLQRAIAMAGGTQKLAKTSEVHVYRQKDGKIGSDDLKFNYDAIRKGQQPDVPLQAYDIVDVRTVGAMAPKSIVEILRNVGTSTLGTLPMRMPIPF
jgi:polysaccharide export outer membrane protein